jgi:hypothetical protein
MAGKGKLTKMQVPPFNTVQKAGKEIMTRESGAEREQPPPPRR